MAYSTSLPMFLPKMHYLSRVVSINYAHEPVGGLSVRILRLSSLLAMTVLTLLSLKFPSSWNRKEYCTSTGDRHIRSSACYSV